MNSPYRCPACGFQVFNRRLKRCEKCQADLPDALLFNEQDLGRIAQDSASIEKQRRDMARESEEAERRKEAGRGGG